jgi:hypothetical protein
MAFHEAKKWLDRFPTAERWYNINHHSIIKMSPFEALYEYPPPQFTYIPLPVDSSEESVPISE